MATIAGPPIRIGVIHSMSGTMAFSERPVRRRHAPGDPRDQRGRAACSAARIEPVIVDGRSDWPTFAREAERLITDEKVVTLFGGWTSASRKSMRPVVERLDHLLLYPVQYEGLEDSLNIIYLGAAPNQQVIPATDWCVQKLGRKRLFLVGSDYVFPRAANAIIRDEAKRIGATIVGEEYLLLGDTDVAAHHQEDRGAVARHDPQHHQRRLQHRLLPRACAPPASRPTSCRRCRSASARASSPRCTASSSSATTPRGTTSRASTGRENRAFEARFHAVYGAERSINDPMEAAYDGVYLWAQAVRAAGSTDVRAIRQAIKGQRFDAPVAQIRIDPEQQPHLEAVSRRAHRAGQSLRGRSPTRKELIAPVPFPDLRTRTEWESMLEDLHESWHGNWANPARPHFAH